MYDLHTILRHEFEREIWKLPSLPLQEHDRARVKQIATNCADIAIKECRDEHSH